MTDSTVAEHGLSNGHDKDKPAMSERATEAFEKGVASAQDAATEARLQAEIAAERAGEQIQKMTECGTKFVRENPGTALVGALGVGVLLGLALRGRD